MAATSLASGLSPTAGHAVNISAPRRKTYAQCYGGHQFGYWAGQLGDGRAISLGEVAGPGGRFELQLKVGLKRVDLPCGVHAALEAVIPFMPATSVGPGSHRLNTVLGDRALAPSNRLPSAPS